MDNLAIVIPAYKADFLAQTLESLAMQTDHRFVVYIGDDSSPEDLFSLVKRYQSRMNLVYRRFEQNIGQRDLVGHWERCVEMAGDEEWVWMFSDDDVMDAECVEAFYRFLETNGDEMDILHFDMKVVDQHDNQIWPFHMFPNHISAQEFFSKRIRNQIQSTGVSYVFKKATWKKTGRFVRFDLAWFSDDATWMRLGADKGIKTVAGPLVYWRYSTRNISSILHDESILRRKVASGLAFMRWVADFFADRGLQHERSDFDKVRYLLSMPLNASVLSFLGKWKYVRYICMEMRVSLATKLAVCLYFVYFVLKDRVRQVIIKK